jgi:peptidoglycan/LPS O-acetylase OafA/YrhL
VNTATATRSYYPALDGLRGIAIMAVLFQHNFNFLPLSKFGWIGVDLFFVLSGFLITDILIKTREQKNFLSGFYLRRILRIFPLYYGVLILFFIVAPLADRINDQYDFYITNQGMLWGHLQNWLYITNSEPNNYGMFTHFWSLSIEEQFYLFWPLVILACKQIKTLLAISCSILFLCIAFRFSTWLYFGNGNLNYSLQYMTRLDGLCVGSLIAVWRYKSVTTVMKKMILLACILLSLHAVTFLLAKLFFPGLSHFSIFGYSSIAIIFGIILVFLIQKRTSLTTIVFENKVLKGLGKISYGLYVYHWPILVLFKIYVLTWLVDSGMAASYSYIIVSLSAAAVAILLSFLSYHLLEKRILALKEVVATVNIIRKLKLHYRSVFAR